MVRQKGYRMVWKMARRTAHPKVVKTAPSSAYPKASMKVEMMGALDRKSVV